MKTKTTELITKDRLTALLRKQPGVCKHCAPALADKLLKLGKASSKARPAQPQSPVSVAMMLGRLHGFKVDSYCEVGGQPARYYRELTVRFKHHPKSYLLGKPQVWPWSADAKEWAA